MGQQTTPTAATWRQRRRLVYEPRPARHRHPLPRPIPRCSRRSLVAARRTSMPMNGDQVSPRHRCMPQLWSAPASPAPVAVPTPPSVIAQNRTPGRATSAMEGSGWAVGHAARAGVARTPHK
ncbi:hypothetical protein HYPSUDRAFT_208214 [Hypholoma sublateritium FD-334 SS-4]|uniref:GCM domain-containing protein n=1 Tax=Hypholoma sublateritium (strain FD-334 SS-4) TaxID=945553 RepID=A0A0D2P3B4_HYPSF|nr:hypothetical protein HYPSUDRAFT_208214 [Hypholoma sublateritium FD-334 SS-4]